ncbi:MAG: HIT family protein [Phycisphaeraceae bacterium]
MATDRVQPEPRDPQCVFCRIVAGEIPAHRVHEDDHVLAFLDVAPLSRGHVLIIPRVHYARLDEMPEALAGACAALAVRVARVLGVVLDGGRGGGGGEALAYNVLQNNGRRAHQAVDHVHFHIIPKPADSDDAPASGDGLTPGRGLVLSWPAGELDHADAATLAEAIRGRLEG